MKRWCAMLLVCAMLASLCACGNTRKTAVDSLPPEQSLDVAETVSPDLAQDAPEPTPEEAGPAMPDPEPTLEEAEPAVPDPETTPEETEPAAPDPETTPKETEPEVSNPELTQEETELVMPAPTTVNYDPAEPIAYARLLEEVNAARRIELETENTFEDFEDYLVNDPATATLLTDQEVELLLNGTYRPPKFVTYEEAVSDVDLLFRAFHMAYASYYFFGEEAFETAEAEVMEWLEGQETVDVEELRQCLRRSTEFMRDGHSSIAVRTVDRTEIWYKYYRCEDQSYSKDETGYYKTLNGEKWFFESFSDENISMQKTLLENGELVYAPVLFCIIDEMKNGTVTLKNAAGSVKKEELIWKDTTAYRTAYGLEEGDADYKFFKESGISYISIRSGHEKQVWNDLMQFAESGAQVKDSTVIILDIRSHGGGSGDKEWHELWVKNFTGEDVQFKWIKTRRASVFQTNYGGEGYLNPRENRYWYSSVGKFIENNVPIILLVDNEVGSGGETMLNAIKTLDNVLVVGSNSAGYQLGGDVREVCLPNTQIECRIGTGIGFFNEIRNVDGMGYEPDVWCDPQYALEAAMNMIDYYDLADTQAVEAMWEQLDGEVFNR